MGFIFTIDCKLWFRSTSVNNQWTKSTPTLHFFFFDNLFYSDVWHKTGEKICFYFHYTAALKMKLRNRCTKRNPWSESKQALYVSCSESERNHQVMETRPIMERQWIKERKNCVCFRLLLLFELEHVLSLWPEGNHLTQTNSCLEQENIQICWRNDA